MATFWSQGETLRRSCEDSVKFRARHHVGDMLHALRTPSDRIHRIIALFGCRLTGKTTMMEQVFMRMNEEEQKATLFVDGEKCPSMDALGFLLAKMANKGVRYAFIDEATQIKGFGENCHIFQDRDFKGMKFVLAGTNSLLLWLTFNDKNAGWGSLVSTAPISYGEWTDVHHIDVPVDEYLCNGGTMLRNFSEMDNNEGLQQYLFSSLGKNLERSVRGYPDSEYAPLLRMARTGVLPLAVNFVIKDVAHSLFYEDIEDRMAGFDSGDRKALTKIIRRTFIERELEEISFINTKFLHAYAALVGSDRFSEKDAPRLGDAERTLVLDALCDTKFLQSWPVRNFSVDREEKISGMTLPFLMTMPCVRYRLTLSAVSELRKILGGQHLPEKMKLQESLAPDSFGSLGSLLEESLFLDIQRAGGDQWEVFKVRFFKKGGRKQDGEIDIVAQGADGGAVLLEVKHTDEPKPSDAEHLRNTKYRQILEKNGIRPTARYVVANTEEDEEKKGYTILSAKKLLLALWHDPKETLEALRHRSQSFPPASI